VGSTTCEDHYRLRILPSNGSLSECCRVFVCPPRVCCLGVIKKSSGSSESLNERQVETASHGNCASVFRTVVCTRTHGTNAHPFPIVV
jgi:hypothetical protein